MDINLILALFAGIVLVLSAFSTALQRLSLPGPVLALTFGVLIGPYALDLLRIEDFGVSTGTLLEQAARITLAVALAGVALLLRGVHDRAETLVLSWFGPLGISALFYATLAERHTGNHDIFVYATLAITASVLIHGLSTAPVGVWISKRTAGADPQHE